MFHIIHYQFKNDAMWAEIVRVCKDNNRLLEVTAAFKATVFPPDETKPSHQQKRTLVCAF